ncbi:MAG: hypothetical protein RSC93_10045 [Erysipelotrichaceae bacterium]
MKLNHLLKNALLVTFMVSLLSGCSYFNKDDTSEKDKVETSKKEKSVEKEASDSIDEVMKWMEQQGIKYNEMETLNEMNFAAHEGRSFKYNENLVYLYRVNTSDEKMNSFLNETQHSKIVNVNENGVEKQYKALVNRDYLMVYQDGKDISQLETLFPTYKAMKNAGSNKGND